MNAAVNSGTTGQRNGWWLWLALRWVVSAGAGKAACMRRRRSGGAEEATADRYLL